MKTIPFKHAIGRLTVSLFCLIFAFDLPVIAQQTPNVRLSLLQAVDLSKAQNMQVHAARSEESATESDLRDAKTNALPTVLTNGDYQRFTSLTLYNHGLNDVRSIPKRPTSNGADLGVSANFNLYAGGRQKALVAEQKEKRDLAAINTKEQAGTVGLEVADQYLNMIRLIYQKHFIDDQVVRAETRLKNIDALYRNQKVTRSDLLRSELNLSAVKLNLEQTLNDIIISNQKLNVLLNLPDSTRIYPTDSAAMTMPSVDTLLDLINSTTHDAYAIRKADESIKIQNARIRG
ncbi:TolC family protein [Mucilaginibacter sp. P25]